MRTNCRSIAGSLGLLGIPVFVFQEGRDSVAERAFKEIARLSKGAWFRFDDGSAATLAKLLSSVAVFATGGLDALEARGRPEDIVDARPSAWRFDAMTVVAGGIAALILARSARQRVRADGCGSNCVGREDRRPGHARA